MEPGEACGNNVFEMAERRDFVNFPAVAQVDAYWEGLRNGRLMPLRSDVDPRGLEGALEFALMLEQIAPGVARIRVAGMHINELLGMEVRGMPLTTLFAPEARSQVTDALKKVVADPRVADIHLTSGAAIGRPALDGRLYLAPLENTHGGTPRIIGCLQSRGCIGRAPRRFDISRLHTRRIIATAQESARAPTDWPKKPALKETVPGFAAPGSKFQPNIDATKKTDKRPYLRLVKSDATEV